MKGRLTTESLAFAGLQDGHGGESGALRFRLYLPPGYGDGASARYPVLYLLHGANGSMKETAWDPFFPLLEDMISRGRIPALIAAVPVCGNSYWVDSTKFGPCESAVIKGLIPHMDAQYNTLTGRENRFIAGFSMGGWGALRYSLNYPELFEACLLLSPALQDEEPPATSRAFGGGAFEGADGRFDRARWDRLNYPAVLGRYAKQDKCVRFFIYAGDEDWNHLNEQDDLPADAQRYNMEVQAVRLYTALKRRNLFNMDFKKGDMVPGNPARLRIAGGGHDVKLWLKGFEEGLDYLLNSI